MIEGEERAVLVEVLTAVYQGMEERGNLGDTASQQYIDPLLLKLSIEDRWDLTEALYHKWAKELRKLPEKGQVDKNSLMELAWYVHP